MCTLRTFFSLMFIKNVQFECALEYGFVFRYKRVLKRYHLGTVSWLEKPRFFGKTCFGF